MPVGAAPWLVVQKRVETMQNPAFRGVLAGLFLTVIGGAAVVLGFGKVDAAAPSPPPVVTCADAEKPSNFVPVPNRIDASCAVIPTDMNGTGDTVSHLHDPITAESDRRARGLVHLIMAMAEFQLC